MIKTTQTPLLWAAEGGYIGRSHIEVVRLLVENGAEVNDRDKYDRTPLHRAAGEGHIEVVRFLVENGAEVNYRDKNYQTPLHRAAERGHREVERFLVAQRADKSF